MNSIKSNRIMQIVYPLLVYYLFYNVFIFIFEYLFAESFGRLFCLMLAALITLIPVIAVYSKSPVLKSFKSFDKKDALTDFFYIIVTVASGIALNIIISKTGLLQNSEGIKAAGEVMSSGGFLLKVLANVIIIPLLEEILYRGIILGQMLLWEKTTEGILLSALLFGIFHFNIVQFLYAFIVGVILGISYKKTLKLWVVFAAHGIINLIVLLFAV